MSLPLDCTLGDTCFIQNYVDHDPGPGAQDFNCGSLSYDDHKGTDFALTSLAQMAAGVDVYPALPGRVVGVRDGMTDVNYVNGTDLGGRECGNGVLIDHGDGYRTQYCHMKNGSVRVGEGEPVFETTLLGQVGLSGKTQFPHLHISLRKDGEIVDPFRPNDALTCGSGTADSLWRDKVFYVSGGLIATGFASAMPDYDTIKAGDAVFDTIPSAAGAIVIWAYVFGGRAGDVIRFDFTGPGRLSFSHSAPLEKTQAQLFRASGKRRTTARWPAGPVIGSVRLMRDGITIDSQSVTTRITK